MLHWFPAAWKYFLGKLNFIFFWSAEACLSCKHKLYDSFTFLIWILCAALLFCFHSKRREIVPLNQTENWQTSLRKEAANMKEIENNNKTIKTQFWRNYEKGIITLPINKCPNLLKLLTAEKVILSSNFHHDLVIICMLASWNICKAYPNHQMLNFTD